MNSQAAKAKERLARYYEAFESGRLKPETLGEKIDELNTQLRALEAEREQLAAQRERLELSALDRQSLLELLDQLDEVLASGTAQQRKHLLHRVVKEVRMHDRRTAEVWYRVPHKPSVRTLEHLAPHRGHVSNFLPGP